MFDLRTLEILNERAHLQAVARAEAKVEYLARMAELKEREVEVDVTPTIFPLARLADRLIVGPPLISHLIDLFVHGDVVAEFNELVRTYLPEYESAIMALPLSQRVTSFTRFFSQSHFPLMDEFEDPDTSMGDLLNCIPVDFQGFTEVDYHAFNDFRPGYILLLSLAETRFDDLDDEDEASPGGRVPIIARMGELVGSQLAGLLPAEGWNLAYIHEKTDDTKFDGCGDFADWIFANTDFWLLNVTQVEYELDGRAGEEWTEDTVDSFTGEWPSICQFWEKLNHLADMLESDMAGNFRELLYLLVADTSKIIPQEQLPLLPS